MSFHIFRVPSMYQKIKDLQEISRLEDKLRLQRETEKQSKDVEHQKYKKLFEPVTKSISSLKSLAPPAVPVANLVDLAYNPIPNPILGIPAVPIPNPILGRPAVPIQAPILGMPAVPIPNPILGMPAVQAQAPILDIPAAQAQAPILGIPAAQAQAPIPLNVGGVHPKVEPPTPLYIEAMKRVPPGSKDDGYFGLNTETERIGPYMYTAGDTNILSIYTLAGEFVTAYMIDDLEYWLFLVSIRPSAVNMSVIKTNFKRTRFLDEYRRLAKELDLVAFAIKQGLTHYKNRSKYILLGLEKGKLRKDKLRKDTSHPYGRGFLFSYRKPGGSAANLIHPSTVVIPSDKTELQRALLTALVELRAGNTSMQNIVVPLARAARRKNILPPNLLSPGEDNWIFA